MVGRGKGLKEIFSYLEYNFAQKDVNTLYLET